MDSINDKKIMVADIGHWETKASFSADDTPRTVFHTLVGEPRFPRFIKSSEEHFMVDPPSEIADMYYLRPVLENGKITKESRFAELISHLQNENKTLKSQDFGFFFSEPLFVANEQKRLMAKIVFEEHKYPFIAFYPQPLMALFSRGITNGLVLEVGHGMTQVAGMYNGFRLSDCFRREDTGGHVIDSFLKDIIHRKGLPIPRDFSNNAIDINNIKEQLIHCGSLDESHVYDSWNSRSLSKQDGATPQKVPLSLPDGSQVQIEDISKDLGELLFRPSLNDLPFSPVQDILFESYQTLDIGIRRLIKDKMFVSGGSTQMPFFSERLAQELNHKQSQFSYGNAANASKTPHESFDIKSVGHPTHSVFIGATVICNTSSGSLFITSKDYEEMGEHGIFRRFN